MSDLLNDVRSILKTTPARWTDLAQSLPAAALTTRPAPNEWSAVECLQHLIDIDKVFRFRLEAFLKGNDFPAFNPDEEGSQVSGQSDPTDLAAEFARQRLESLYALDAVTERDFERTSRHSELGLVTLRQMLNEWAAHDLNHTMQAERAVMQPFLRACGPWQIYFASQVIQG